MRLAYFSPLPPSKSGIADYSAELLTDLARGAELKIFVEQANETCGNTDQSGYEVEQAIHCDKAHREKPFDLCIYYQGNNPYHEYIYERALTTSGLLVLHEHCLHHMVVGKTLARDDQESYWDEMFFSYGRHGSRIAEMRGLVGSEYQQFLLPLNRRLFDGVMFGSSNNHDTHPAQLPIIRGAGSLELHVPNLELPHNTYFLSLKAYTENGEPHWLDPADIHNQMYLFDVITDEVIHGLMKFNADWSRNDGLT